MCVMMPAPRLLRALSGVVSNTASGAEAHFSGMHLTSAGHMACAQLCSPSMAHGEHVLSWAS